MYNVVNTLAPSFLIGCSSFLQVKWTTIKSRTGLQCDQIKLRTAELAAFERLEQSPYTYNGKNGVTTLAL